MGGLAAGEAGEGDDRRYFLFFVMLFGAAAMLAVIACFNVAGLLLARGLTRQRELAILRKAAGRLRQPGSVVARQTLRKLSGLVGAGAALGLVIDSFLRDRLSYVRWPSAYNLPLEFHFQNDRGLYFYAMAAVFSVLVASSLLPVWRGARMPTLGLGHENRERPSSLSVARGGASRNSFLTIQVAACLVELTLWALFCRSFLQVAGVNPGFDVGGIP